MNQNNQKRLSGIIAIACAILFAAVFTGSPEIALNGTVESNGIGRALQLIFVGAVLYAASMFILSRIFNQTEE